MSAYAHQMEREISAQSLSSRGVSEMGSHYVAESGFYITSFVATFFISSLVTVGVLLTTLLVSLSVMLQSCQDRSKGVIEIQKLSHDYNYCKMFALHAELNSMGPDDFPSMCMNVAFQHINGGAYERDLNVSLLIIERYFDSILPLDDGLDAVLMDIDDIFPSNIHYTSLLKNRVHDNGSIDCFQEEKHLRQIPCLSLYTKLQASGWSLILLSRKPEKQRNATIQNLISAGYRGWSSMIMRSDNEIEIDSREYFSRRMVAMQKAGFRISGVISSQMDALTSASLGQRVFKLPNPVYYNLKHHTGNSCVLE
ncbi:hypothetical protein SADUNF_Sadunf10G0148000 [Salix dunnii]|uniref:Acid phosphatase n=1 Tax=Salix dunnii TaxID=1413687 RepID=A0A835JT64_9ROSI|nr:hypothetical protein SADUNF_Sadunf10G0148000 [Salix dunnii]